MAQKSYSEMPVLKFYQYDPQRRVCDVVDEAKAAGRFVITNGRRIEVCSLVPPGWRVFEPAHRRRVAVNHIHSHRRPEKCVPKGFEGCRLAK